MMQPIDLRELATPETGETTVDETVEHAVHHASLLAAASLQRDVSARVRVPRDDRGALVARCSRWLGDGSFRVGLADPELTGLTEVLLGAPPATSPRALTPLELRVLRSRLAPIVAPVARELGAPLHGETLAETDPPAPGDAVLAVELRVAGTPYTLVVAVPGRAESSDDDERSGHEIAAAVGAVPLELVVALTRVRLSAADLATLAPGDVIRCGHAEHEPLPATAAGRVLLRGHLAPGERRVEFHVVSTRIGASA